MCWGWAGQASKSFHEYEDSLHIVNNSEALHELVHSYLGRGLTLKEHWEVALAVDLHAVNNTESEMDVMKHKHADAIRVRDSENNQLLNKVQRLEKDLD